MKSRTDFIAYIHKKFYNKDIYNDKCSKNFPIVFLKHEPSRDISNTISQFRDLLSYLLPDNFIKNLNYLDIANLIDLNSHYEQGLIIFTSYNKLYDLFIEKGLTDTKLINLYRIEGDSGKGIYQDLIHKNKTMLDNFVFSKKTPAPMEDSVLKSLFGARLYINEYYQKEWFFAFQSKDDALNWFDSEDGMMDYIIENGNPNIVEYKVDSCFTLSTKNQTAFKMKKAQKLKSEPFKKDDLILKLTIDNLSKKHKIKNKIQLGFDF